MWIGTHDYARLIGEKHSTVRSWISYGTLDYPVKHIDGTHDLIDVPESEVHPPRQEGQLQNGARLVAGFGTTKTGM